MNKIKEKNKQKKNLSNDVYSFEWYRIHQFIAHKIPQCRRVIKRFTFINRTLYLEIVISYFVLFSLSLSLSPCHSGFVFSVLFLLLFGLSVDDGRSADLFCIFPSITDEMFRHSKAFTSINNVINKMTTSTPYYAKQF